MVATFALDRALLRRYADGGLDTPGLEAGAVLTMTNLLALGLCQACRRGPRAWFLIGFEVAGMVAIAATIVWLRTASATRINEMGNILGHWGNVYLIPFEWLLPGFSRRSGLCAMN